MTRCDRFRETLSERGFDAAVLHRAENMRYLTGGYTGEGCVLVAKEALVIITDFRYTECAERCCPEARVEMTTFERREKQIIFELAKEYGIRTLAVETDFLSHDAFTELEKALPGVALGKANGLTEGLRLIKDEGEIGSICRAASVACRAFENILDKIHAGMTEKQVRMMLDYEMLSLGSEGSAFDTIAAAGVNGSLPHAVPSDYVLQKGDLLTLDFGAKIDGYCSDMTRTVGIGHIGGQLRNIYDLVLEAHLASLNAVAPGRVCRDLDRIARDRIDAVYPGSFGHSLGHGVGLFIHEQPRVSRDSGTVLEAGHVITVEPGVYIPGLGGCRIEDTAILTSDGFIDPVTSPKQLLEL